jgi:hypothetical protein
LNRFKDPNEIGELAMISRRSLEFMVPSSLRRGIYDLRPYLLAFMWTLWLFRCAILRICRYPRIDGDATDRKIRTGNEEVFIVNFILTRKASELCRQNLPGFTRRENRWRQAGVRRDSQTIAEFLSKSESRKDKPTGFSVEEIVKKVSSMNGYLQ